ncbi:MAG: hypothetical protein ABIS86_21265, partial [Streptosporangiaceae bacterium]
DQAHGDVRGERVRFLKRLRVWEVSPVLVGAGRTATLSTKSAVQSTAVTAELRRLHEEFLRREVRCVKERFMARQARLEVAAARFRKLEETGYWYTDCSAPSAAHAKTAALMMELCAAELGIEAPLPVLVWFTPESAKAKAYVKQYGVRDWSSLGSEDPLWGAYRKNDHTVWISAGLPVGQAMEIVAHEMRHAAGGDEDEAQAYERAWSAKLPHPN